MYKKIALNTLSQILSKVVTAAISIVLIGLLTKNLSLELYGVYNKVFSYLGIFAFLADLGLYTIAIREISQSEHPKEKIIGNILTLRTALGVVICILSLVIALCIPGYHDAFTLGAIAIVGIFTLLSLINSSLLALMQSQMKMEFSVVSLISGKILNLAGIAGLFAIGLVGCIDHYAQFLLIFAIATLGIGLTTYMNYLYARRICSIKFLCDWEYIRHIFHISLPYGLALFLSVVYFKVDVILISVLEPQGIANASIALYSLPMKIVEVLMVLGGFYLNSLLPTLSSAFRESQNEKIQMLYGTSLKVLASFALYLCVMGNLFKTEIVQTLATSEYIDVGSRFSSVDVMGVVFWVLVFHFLSLLNIYMLIAQKRQGLLLRLNAGITLINIIGNIILIPVLSFYGAALVTLLSQIILFLVSSVIIHRERSYLSLSYVFQFLKSAVLALALYLLSSWVFELWGTSAMYKMLFGGFAVSLLYLLGELLLSFHFLKKIRKSL